MDTPLDNPRWERYCQARACGKTQRKAMLDAYPSRVKWKPESVDKAAQRLESNAQVKPRIESLKRMSAADAVMTRAKVLDGMGAVFAKASGKVGSWNGPDLPPVASGAVAKVGSALLDSLPDDVTDHDVIPPVDFGVLLIAPFLPMHRSISEDTGGDWWLPGGRGSGKSTIASLEIVDGMMHHQERSALVAMKNGVDIRDSVWEQMSWAISRLGYEDEFDELPSRRRMVRRSTGQAIVFRGCDKPDKTKSIKAPDGTYFAYQWFEEVDLFNGMREVRTVTQSATRGAASDAPFFRFETFNPPRSLDGWANRETSARESAGLPVYRSTFLDLPREWVPDQMRADAELLRTEDEQAYRHEWLGEAVGIGGEVFDRVEFRTISDDEISAVERPMAGQDFGWWPDPWAMTLSGWDSDSRTLLTYREDGGNKLTPPQSAERAKAMLTWADHDGEEPYLHNIPVSSDDAAPEQIAAQRTAGLNARAAEKGNMRLASYRWLASIRWVIDPARCPKLAEEARSKMHVQNRDGTWQEDIEDGDDHLIDATRYAVMPIVRRTRQAYHAT